jgi:hypothetical protein
MAELVTRIDVFNAGHKDFETGTRCHLNPFKMSYKWTKWTGDEGESNKVFEPGLYFHLSKGFNELLYPIWIANPIYVIGMGFSVSGLMKEVKYKNVFDKWVTADMEVRELMHDDSEGVLGLGLLLERGFVFDIEHKDKLINYLIRERPRSESSN